MAIDWDEPIRTQRTKRRLHVIGWWREGQRVDFNPHGRQGFKFYNNGEPHISCTLMGKIENFEESPFVEVVDTERERECDAFADAMGDNELFGIF